MAFDLAYLKNQVNLYAGGHDGLDAYVARWANLTLWDMATRAFWTKQMEIGFAHASGAANLSASTLSSHWFSLNVTNTRNTANVAAFVAPYRVDQVSMSATNGTGSAIIGTYGQPLLRLEVNDLYNRYANQSPAAVTNATVSYYALVQPHNDTASIPKFAVYPPFASSTITQGGALAVQYLGAPFGLTNSTDTTWMLTKYPRVVLAGVLSYVAVYLGDIQDFLVRSSEYENGIADMLRIEEVHLASKPVKRGVTMEYLNRG